MNPDERDSVLECLELSFKNQAFLNRDKGKFGEVGCPRALGLPFTPQMTRKKTKKKKKTDTNQYFTFSNLSMIILKVNKFDKKSDEKPCNKYGWHLLQNTAMPLPTLGAPLVFLILDGKQQLRRLSRSILIHRDFYLHFQIRVAEDLQGTWTKFYIQLVQIYVYI